MLRSPSSGRIPPRNWPNSCDPPGLPMRPSPAISGSGWPPFTSNRMPMYTPDAEVIIVGGGPAGSTMATRLAQRGHRVLLLDKAKFPRHKACSEYINAGAAQLLDQMGAVDEVLAAGAHRMDAMIVHAPNGSRFMANFAKAEPGRAALGLSRFTF